MVAKNVPERFGRLVESARNGDRLEHQSRLRTVEVGHRFVLREFVESPHARTLWQLVPGKAVLSAVPGQRALSRSYRFPTGRNGL